MSSELRRLLLALGYDASHTAERIVDPKKGVGLQVYRAGEPVKFLLARKLAAKREDADFLRAWEASRPVAPDENVVLENIPTS